MPVTGQGCVKGYGEGVGKDSLWVGVAPEESILHPAS